jgi:hypothetical protein
VDRSTKESSKAPATPQVKSVSRSPHVPTYLRPDGEHREEHEYRRARAGGGQDEEELFGQLWNVPNPRPRVPEAKSNGGCLVWVRRDLLREKRVTPQDCFPVNKAVRLLQAPKRLSFALDIWRRGEKATFTDIVRRSAMADGGRWIWQPNMPQRVSTRPP